MIKSIWPRGVDIQSGSANVQKRKRVIILDLIMGDLIHELVEFFYLKWVRVRTTILIRSFVVELKILKKEGGIF